MVLSTGKQLCMLSNTKSCTLKVFILSQKDSADLQLFSASCAIVYSHRQLVQEELLYLKNLKGTNAYANILQDKK
jgi:hypothetical protein